MDNDSFFKGRSTFSCLFGPIIGAVNQKTLLPCTSDIKLVTSQSQNSQTRKGKKKPLNVTPKNVPSIMLPNQEENATELETGLQTVCVCVCVYGALHYSATSHCALIGFAAYLSHLHLKGCAPYGIQ